MSLGNVSVSFDVTDNFAGLANTMMSAMQPQLLGRSLKGVQQEDKNRFGDLFDGSLLIATNDEAEELNSSALVSANKSIDSMSLRFDKGARKISERLDSLVSVVSGMSETLSSQFSRLQQSIVGAAGSHTAKAFGDKAGTQKQVRSDATGPKKGEKKRKNTATNIKQGVNKTGLDGFVDSSSKLINNTMQFKQSLVELSGDLGRFEWSRKSIMGVVDSSSNLVTHFSTVKQSFAGFKQSFLGLKSLRLGLKPPSSTISTPTVTGTGRATATGGVLTHATSTQTKGGIALDVRLKGVKSAVDSGSQLVSRYQTFKTSIAKLSSEIQAFDFSKQGMAGVAELGSRFVSTYESGSRMITAFGKFRHSLAGLSGSFGVTSQLFAQSKARLFAFATALRTGALMQWGLNAAMLANPIGLVVGALAGAGVLIYKYWQPIKAFLGGLFDGFVASMLPVFTALGPLLTLLSPIGDAFAWVGSKVGELVSGFGSLFNPMRSSQEELANFAASGMKFGEIIGSVFSAALSPITLVAKGIGWVGKKLGLFGDDAPDTETFSASAEGASKAGTLVADQKESLALTSPTKTKFAAAGAGLLAATSAAALSAPVTASALAQPPTEPTTGVVEASNNAVMQSYELSPLHTIKDQGKSQQTKSVTQHINVQVTVNNPSNTVNVQQAIESALRNQASNASPSLSDKEI